MGRGGGEEAGMGRGRWKEGGKEGGRIGGGRRARKDLFSYTQPNLLFGVLKDPRFIAYIH